MGTFLELHSGVLPLGRVSAQFMGLKRQQLEKRSDVFELHRVGKDGQWSVRLVGCEAENVEIMLDGAGASKDNAKLTGPLDQEVVDQIREKLAEQPDQELDLRNIQKEFPSVRREQLAEHFEVHRFDKKRFKVRLSETPGLVGVSPAPEPKQKKPALVGKPSAKPA